MGKRKSIRILSDPDSQNDLPRNFYLWGYQPHFWISAKGAAEALFRPLDDAIVPDIFLVAINSEHDGNAPAVVIEPEDHQFQPSDFCETLKLAEQMERITPGPSYGYPAGSVSGEAWAAREERRAYCGRLGQAIAQIIESACADEQPKVFISPAREVGPYVIYSVLVLDRRQCDVHPLLHKTKRDCYSIMPSLLCAAGRVFVETCSDTILSSFEGQGFGMFPATDSLLRAAGARFMYTPFGACEEGHGLHGGFETCNEISTLTYEKVVGRGRLILARRGHENISQSISFRNPPQIRNYRAVRKLMQLAGDDEGLICDSLRVRGIGRICGTYNTANEDLFCVEFIGHAKWQLVHGGVPLMRVEHGIPGLPKKNLQVRHFAETFTRIFPNATDKQQQQMKQVAAEATELSHGAILVVAENAAEESARFGNQCTIIDPQPLTARLLETASRIDGAILATPDGVCHAIGVILDGQVTKKGTAERGARFNSTVRYVHGSKEPCIGLVVSDDGMIDVVPEYRCRVSKYEIERNIRELRELIAEPTVNQRKMNKKMDWINDHRFYYSDEECKEINQLIASAEGKSDKSAAWCIYDEFRPHEEMNDSFLS